MASEAKNKSKASEAKTEKFFVVCLIFENSIFLLTSFTDNQKHFTGYHEMIESEFFILLINKNVSIVVSINVFVVKISLIENTKTYMEECFVML